MPTDPEPSKVAVILAAAGKGRRFQESGEGEVVNKTFAELAGKPVWLHSVEKFVLRDEVRQLIVVVAPDELEWFRSFYAQWIDRYLILVVPGGKERADSVQNALRHVSDEIELVAVHDAARPCVSGREIDEVFQAAREHGAAMLASPVVGTLKRVRDGMIRETVPRDGLWEAQTPQVFRKDILLKAYGRRSGDLPTDDAQLAEQAGYSVFIVPTERWNLKITTRTDLTVAESLIFLQNNDMDVDLSEK